MSRPRIENDHTRALEEVVAARKGAMNAARIQADELIQAAKDNWRNAYLRAVRECIEAGISAYKIGQITGNTSSVARRALIEEAMGKNYLLPGSTKPAPPTDDLTVLGWTLRRTQADNPNGEPGGDPWRVVGIESPSGDQFTLRMMDTYGYWLVDDEPDDPTVGRKYHSLAPEFVWDWLTRKNWGDEPAGWYEALAAATALEDGFEVREE